MSERMKTVLCGIGGYGRFYLENFFGKPQSPLDFVGFVDPMAERAPSYAAIQAAGTPVQASLEAFYADARADLAIVSSPIQFHAAQTVCALDQGSHVLCEKPLCASLEEIRQMLAAKQRTGLSVALGYQASYAESTRRLKSDILAGVWGRPVELKCVVRWPRGLDYYARNSWAGRIKDGQGRMILDSPVNNAAAHSLHHMLYLLGDSERTSAVPLQVEAQLYRANPIENYDTAFLLAELAGGARMLFIATHAVEEDYGPEFEFVFEKGTVKYRMRGQDVVGTFKAGGARNYGSADPQDRAKVTDTVAAIQEGRESRCGIEAALSQTLCMLAAQESGAPVTAFPENRIRRVRKDGGTVCVVEGLAEIAMRAYDSFSLPDPGWASWVRPARKVPVPCLGPESRHTV